MEEQVECVLRQMQGKDDVLCEQVTQLHLITNNLNSLAPNYDYNESVKHNGIRSFVNIVDKFIHLLSQQCNVTPSSSVIRKINCLRRLSPLLLRTAVAVEMSTKRPSGLESSDFSADNESIDRNIIEILFSLTADELQALHVNGIRNFYLESDIRKTLDKYFFPLIPFRLLSIYQAFKTVFDRQKLAQFVADYSMNGTLFDIRSVWNAGDGKTNRMFLQWKTSKLKCGKIIKVYLNRSHNDWLICDGGTVTHADKRDGQIKCYLHLPPNYRKDKLVFYMHGGAYIALTSKSFEAQLTYMSRKLRIPILTIDYGLVPENAFPGPLQDALDAYLALALNADNEKVKQLLYNIDLSHIVVSGDSAGAHLSVALVYALNEIRKQSRASVIMPISVNLQFPVAQLLLGPMSPSRCLLCIDSLLPPSIILTATSASSGLLNRDEDTFLNQSTRGIASGHVSYLGKILSNEQTKAQGHRMIQDQLSMLNDPYRNLLVYNDIDSLKDIPLYVHASEYDPLLDDAIALCRFWRGPVTFDVAEGVMHGFPPFAGFSDACKKAFKASIHQIQQAVEKTHPAH